MKKGLLNKQDSESAHERISAATWEMCVSLAEQLLDGTTAKVHSDDVFALCRKLIEIYDRPFIVPFELRRRAASAVAKIAAHDIGVLDLVIDNAKLYAKQMHVDDAFPYAPNAFDVFAEINPIHERVTSLLLQIVRDDWGVAKWSAARALHAIEGAPCEALVVARSVR